MDDDRGDAGAFVTPPLRITPQPADEPGVDAAVLLLEGEVDLSSAHVLADAIEDQVGQGHRRVVLDLADVTFVNSTGLGVMVAATKRLRAAGGDLVVRRFRGIPASALAITELDQFLTIES